MTSIDDVASDARATTFDFVDNMVVNANSRTLIVPDGLCDLSPLHSSPLDIGSNSPIQVDIWSIQDGPILYNIRTTAPLDTNVGRWVLVTTSATTVLECLRRRCGPSTIDIVLFLLKKGASFNTAVSAIDLPTSISCPSPERFVGLGFRDADYKPDAFDYAAYEERRTTFLLTPRGRAAMMQGGIVWRLAKETLEDRWNDVVQGPTDSVRSTGEELKLVDGRSLWDDRLTTEELNLICGVYKQATGMSVKVVAYTY
jgi:hypothetical protein